MVGCGNLTRIRNGYCPKGGRSFQNPVRGSMKQVVGLEADNTATDQLGCARCGRHTRRGWGFGLNTAPALAGRGVATQLGEGFKCARCALLHAPMLWRSLMVALVVGTALTLLNHGDTIFAGHWRSALYWKIPLTYCTPFCVATFGALTGSRR